MPLTKIMLRWGLSLEIANVTSPLEKYKKTSKPTIMLIIAILTFGEIDSKRVSNIFSKVLNIITAKKKSWIYKEKIDLQIFVYIIKI